MTRSEPLAAIALALLLSGCSYEPVDFTFLQAEPESIDPSLTSGVPDGRLARGLFCGLTGSHPDTLEDLPELATHWETSDDGLVWTFHLRESTWSDGVPLTAEDFVWTYKRILEPTSESKFVDQFFILTNSKAYYKGELTDFSEVGVRAVDPYTLELRLDAPVPYLTQLTSFVPFFPVPRHAIEKWGTSFWTKPGKIVSNGPYILDEWRFRERIVLAKNPLYWDKENVQLNRIAAIPVEAENTAFTFYETGLADWADRTSIPLTHVLDDLKGRPDLHMRPYLGTYYISINTTYPPMDDARVRRAFSLAIDRRSITENITRSGERPATGLVYPEIPGYTPGAGRVREDRDEARRLLAEAGYPGGEGLPYLELLYNTNENHKAIGEVLQKQWKDVLGVHIELRNTEWQVYLEAGRQLAYKGFLRSGWIGDYLDASTFLRVMTEDAGNNYTGFANAEYEETLAAALLETDPAKRLELYQRCEEIVLTEQPLIPLYFYTQVKLIKPWVSGDNGNLMDKLMLKWIRVDKKMKEHWLEHGTLPETETPPQARVLP